MDLEKFEKMAKIVNEDIEKFVGSSLMYYLSEMAEVKDLMAAASKILPEHREFFETIYTKVGYMSRSDCISAMRHLFRILEIEKQSENSIKDLKIFQSAEEKLRESSLSFQKEDFPSCVHNLNTALELVLKDKIGIPATITGINTSNIIDLLTKHKVQPYLYLEEARKHVLVIDNKIKHQGYCPTKVDCINGIKAIEEVVAKLRNMEMKLTEDVRNKIYEGL
jgi:hypothetical protein